MYFFELLVGFVKIDTWISLACFMDLSRFIHDFFLVVTLATRYMDLLTFLHGFVKIVLCTSKPNAKQNKAEV